MKAGASHQDRGFAPVALSRHALCRVGRTIQSAFAFVGLLGPCNAQTGHGFFFCSLFGKRDKLLHEHALGINNATNFYTSMQEFISNSACCSLGVGVFMFGHETSKGFRRPVKGCLEVFNALIQLRVPFE